MQLGPVSGPAARGDTPTSRPIFGRFGLTRYLPAILLELQVWLWLPSVGNRLRPADRVSQFERLTFAAALVLLVGMYILAMFIEPGLASFRRFLEGMWPDTGLWRALARRRAAHYERVSMSLREDLARGEQLNSDAYAASAGDQNGDRERRRLIIYSRIRDLPPTLTAPTRLGNILRAAEARVRARYALSPSLVFPRLYPLLPSSHRNVLDDARFQVEVKEDYCASFLCATVLSIAAIVAYPRNFSPVWLVLAASNYLLAYQAYRGAIAAARTYVQYFEGAFDLYRFELYRTLSISLPKTADEEKKTAQVVNQLVGREHLPEDLRYAYPLDTPVHLDSIATTMEEVLDRRTAGPRLDAFHGYVSVRLQSADGDDAEFHDGSFIVTSNIFERLRVTVTLSTMRPSSDQLVERIDIDGEGGKTETTFSILPDIEGGIPIPLEASVTVPVINGQASTQFHIEGVAPTESREAFIEILQKNRSVAILRFLAVIGQGSS